MDSDGVLRGDDVLDGVCQKTAWYFSQIKIYIYYITLLQVQLCLEYCGPTSNLSLGFCHGRNTDGNICCDRNVEVILTFTLSGWTIEPRKLLKLFSWKPCLKELTKEINIICYKEQVKKCIKGLRNFHKLIWIEYASLLKFKYLKLKSTIFEWNF